MKRVKLSLYGELHQILSRDFFADVPDDWDEDNLTERQTEQLNEAADRHGIDWYREDGMESGDYADEAIEIEEATEIDDPASIDPATNHIVDMCKATEHTRRLPLADHHKNYVDYWITDAEDKSLDGLINHVRCEIDHIKADLVSDEWKEERKNDKLDLADKKALLDQLESLLPEWQRATGGAQ